MKVRSFSILRAASHSRLFTSRALGVFAVMIWLLPGCEEAPNASKSPACQDTLDCPEDMRCDELTRSCVPLPASLSVVDFELMPLRGSGAAATQIPAIDLGKSQNSTNLPLEVVSAVKVFGQISAPQFHTGVSGTLVANRHSAIDDRKLLWNIHAGENGQFTEGISPGQMEFVFKPSNRYELPQMMVRGIAVADQANAEVDLSTHLGYPVFPGREEFASQTPENFKLLHGRVLQSQNAPQSVSGLRVEAITEHGLRSSLAIPDNFGNFYLMLPVQRLVAEDNTHTDDFPRTVDLIIRPEANNSLLPTIMVTSLSLSKPDLGTFYLGEVPFSRAISGAVVDSQGAQVADTQLRFECSQVGNGGYVLQTRTDSQGKFRADLPSGTYRITAIPPSTGRAGIGYVPVVDLTENLDGLRVALPDRSGLGGTIWNYQNRPVGEVTVRAIRLADHEGKEDGIIRNYECQSQADGSFNIAVDNGLYLVEMIPPPSSGLPRSVPQRVYVGDDGVTLSSDATTLPSPAVIRGHVINREGRPMCGVTIMVFYRDQNHSYLIGQAISGDEQAQCEGSYAVLLPGTPSAEAK